MQSIIVVGSCNTDMVIKSDRLPIPGETIIGGSFFMNPGGKGANQAVAAARLGGKVTFVSKTGNDVFGKQSVVLYNHENINTEFIFSDSKLPSGVALINVDAYGENSIVVASGANANLKPADIEIASKAIEEGDIILMQLEIPIETVEYTAKKAFEKGKKVILNPAPAQALSDTLLKQIDIIIPNRNEAEILSGIKVVEMESAQEAAKVIAQKGVNTVIITLGNKGALIFDQGEFNFVPALVVEPVDTTAAGDTFCGAFSVGLAEGKSLIEAVQFAVKASAISVTRMGAQSSSPYRTELAHF